MFLYLIYGFGYLKISIKKWVTTDEMDKLEEGKLVQWRRREEEGENEKEGKERKRKLKRN